MARVLIGLPYKSPGVTIVRFGKFDWVIPYTIDGVGPFEVRVPEEEFSSSKGEEMVRAAASQQLGLYNKEIVI